MKKILANNSKTKPENIFLGIETDDPATNYNVLSVALQDLYEKMQEQDLFTEIDIFEEHEPPQNITGMNRLLLDKMLALADSL